MATAYTFAPNPGAKGPRMCKTVVDLGGDIMRDALYHQISPNTILVEVVSSPRLRKNPLSAVQMGILGNAVQRGDYKECDITLTYTVLRNCAKTNKVLCPSKGWGKVPVQPGDVKLGDDLERIRICRNEIYGHVPTTDMSTVQYIDYMQKWQDICMRMDGTHASLLSSPNPRNQTYSQRLYDIQHCCMDSDTEEKYIKELKRMADEEGTRKEEERKIKDELNELSGN